MNAMGRSSWKGMLITSQNRYFLMFYSLMKDFFLSSADLMLHDLKLASRKKEGNLGANSIIKTTD